MILVILITLATGKTCKYDPRELIYLSYLSEKLESTRDNKCEKCKADCESQKGVLLRLPGPEEAMIGRQAALSFNPKHYLLQTPIVPPYPGRLEEAIIGMGCFWGVERVFWQLEGVISTAVGYAGGITPNPLYEEVYTGYTGHSEVVKILFDPRTISYRKLLKVFWEKHDPTQGMQQGEDEGTQYRSLILALTPEQKEIAIESRSLFQKELYKLGLGTITTLITPAYQFYYAEDYHQQYLAKRPGGYCGIRGTGAFLPKSFE
jgi:peptide-methionine (S)-S-oxide reductase